MSEHAPGTAVKVEDGWHIICACGDRYCAEDWDYEAIYRLHLPEGMTVADLPFVHVKKSKT